jgi:hypothetical protein
MLVSRAPENVSGDFLNHRIFIIGTRYGYTSLNSYVIQKPELQNMSLVVVRNVNYKYICDLVSIPLSNPGTLVAVNPKTT